MGGRAAIDEPSVLYLPLPTLGIGPLRVRPGEITRRVRALTQEPTEECTVMREDGLCGLRLDYQASDHEHGEPFPYELTVWGADWQALASRVLSFDAAAPAA